MTLCNKCNGTACTGCEKTHILEAGLCIPCNTTYKTCDTTEDNCTTCNSITEFVFKGTCISCDNNLLATPSVRCDGITCSECVSNLYYVVKGLCTLCSGEDSCNLCARKECPRCNSGYELHEDGNCDKCEEPCETCQINSTT